VSNATLVVANVLTCNLYSPKYIVHMLTCAVSTAYDCMLSKCLTVLRMLLPFFLNMCFICACVVCRGNMVLQDIKVASLTVLRLACPAASVAPNMFLMCTGNYTVQPEDLEKGELSFTVNVTSPTLPASQLPVTTPPAVVTMVALPRLVVDVVAGSCNVLNGTGKPVIIPHLQVWVQLWHLALNQSPLLCSLGTTSLRTWLLVIMLRSAALYSMALCIISLAVEHPLQLTALQSIADHT